MSRIAELNQLKDNVAGLNQKAAQQERAALGISLQKTAQQAPVIPGGAVQQAQQIAPQAAQQQAQIGLKQQQQTQQQQAELTRQQLQKAAYDYGKRAEQESRRLQQEIFKRELASKSLVTNQEIASRKRVLKSDLESRRRLQKAGFYYDQSAQFATWQARKSFQAISQAAKSRFMDERLAFKREQGRLRMSNEQQLFDFAVVSAKNQQEYLQKAQIIEQISDLKVSNYQRAIDRLEQRLKSGFISREQKLDQNMKNQILHDIGVIKQAQRRENARKISRMQKRKAMGQFIGAAIGVGATFATAGAAAPAAATIMAGAGTGATLGGAGAVYTG